MTTFGASAETTGAFGREQLRDLPEVRVIPYDYVAEFDLTGEVGNLVQDVINISIEGVFVAVSIGYGLDEEPPDERIELPRRGSESNRLGDLRLDDLPADLLIEGFRLHPSLAPLVRRRLAQRDRLPDGEGPLDIPLDGSLDILQRTRRSEGFSFLLSIVDAASGRELQNEPVHSIAGLGGEEGRRPFKMLPQPMVFMPRSTLRLQIEERSAGVRGRLYLTVQGYKVLGQNGRPEEQVRGLGRFDPPMMLPVYDHGTGNFLWRGEAGKPDVPNRRVVPFDYVSTLQLTGEPGRLVDDEVPINVDGGYLATALGYSLDSGDLAVGIEPARSDLKSIALRDIRPLEALFDGIRIHPLRLRFAFGCDGRLTSAAPQDLVGRLFQRVNLPNEVSFRFTVTDSGTGRELQSRPVHNVAGLGAADGGRPFRVLHKPMAFLPRSTIRVQVRERRGSGRLFIVFQGYKVLEGSL